MTVNAASRSQKSSSVSSSAATKKAASRIPSPYNKYTQYVLEAAKKYKLPPSILFGMMERESNGQNIRGDFGHGRGLMQIDDRSHGAWLASHDGGMDPKSNIMYGAQILRESMNAFGGDLRKGLAAYNAGVGGVESAIRSGRSPDSATTGGNYGRDVIAKANRFKKALQGVDTSDVGGSSGSRGSSRGGRANGSSGSGGTTAADGASGTSGTRNRRSTDNVGSHTLLKEGARGEEVKELQKRLSDAGFKVPSNGVFDAKTAAAVKAYQKAKGLQVDGIVGQQTWGSFFGQSYPPGSKMLKHGSFTASAASTGGGTSRSSGASAPGDGGAADRANADRQANNVRETNRKGNQSKVEKILDEARSHLGFHEGAGNNNPFSHAMGRPSEAWCADFVSYCVKKAGLSTVNTASAQGIQDQLEAKGRWKGLHNPQPGDALTFNWSGSRGWADHVGMVEKVFKRGGVTYVQTIEGNSSDGVRRKVYPWNSSVIKGYGSLA